MTVGTLNHTFLPFAQRQHLDKIEMILIEHLPCSSFSHIQAIGYDVTVKILKIDYKSGSIYTYFQVPESIFQTMLTTSNIGKYLNSHIKGNYPYQRFIPHYI
ncbi:MAG: KTSC domain-containing protein [Crocosphaera sp.]|nr:KTSC domain-containing protein [Crocosphaera sp.]